MLTDKELELYKICKLPFEISERWLFLLMPKPDHIGEYLDIGQSCGIGQKCSLGGDTDELFIYHHSDDEYYLIQALVSEATE